MNQSEYERWRQHLEEELEAAFDLVRAGFRAQMRVLDQVRTASPATPERGSSAAKVVELPPAPQPAPVPSTAPATAVPLEAPPERKRRPAGELFDRVVEALQALPEVFDSSALMAALHPQPQRSTLYQTLQHLQNGGWIERLEFGSGTRPSRFRQLEVEDDEPDET